MNTDTHNNNDSRTLWVIAAIVVFAILAYVAYASYRNDNYPVTTDTGTVSSTTTNTTTNQ
mgnify:CR=1 FL=1